MARMHFCSLAISLLIAARWIDAEGLHFHSSSLAVREKRQLTKQTSADPNERNLFISRAASNGLSNKCRKPAVSSVFWVASSSKRHMLPQHA